MSNTIFLTALVYVVVAVAGAFLYQVYFKYKYEKEKLESQTITKKKISYKALVSIILYSAFHDIMTTVCDELTNSLENSLGDVTFKEKYF